MEVFSRFIDWSKSLTRKQFQFQALAFFQTVMALSLLVTIK